MNMILIYSKTAEALHQKSYSLQLFQAHCFKYNFKRINESFAFRSG